MSLNPRFQTFTTMSHSFNLNEAPMNNPEYTMCFCGVPVMDCVTDCPPLPLSVIVPPRTEFSRSPSYSVPAAATSHPEWNTCFCGYPMIHCHCTVAPSVSSIIEEALENVPPPSPLKRDQACRKSDDTPDIITRAKEAERIHAICGKMYLDCNCFPVPCDSNGELIPIQNFCYQCIGNKTECECDPLLADPPINMGAAKTWVDVYTSVESHKVLCVQGIFHRKTYSQTTIPKEYGEDDWEEVPSGDEADEAPSADETPLADEEPQERGCNDCGYIACSQDCGMRNFD